MPTVPNGFANVLLPIHGGDAPTGAAVTFGVRNNLVVEDPTVMADAIFDAWAATLQPFLDVSLIWGPVHVQIGTLGGIISGDGTESDSGGADVEPVPINTAVLVSKSSAQPGRGGRGRYYWPGAANEADVSPAGIWGSASVANFQGAQTDFLEALETAELPMAILHAGAGTPAIVTALTVQATLGTQRRRMRR